MTAMTPTIKKRWRFTIRALLLMLLGIAVGLAAQRATHDWGESIFAGFLTWFTIGLIQRTWQAVGLLPSQWSLSPEIRWGAVLECAWPVFALTLLLMGLVIEVSFRQGWLPWSTWSPETGTVSCIGQLIVALSLVSAYSHPPQWIAGRPRRSLYTQILEVGGFVGGVIWLVCLTAELTLITALVHLACDNMRVTSALQIFGHRVSSPDVPRDLMRYFVDGALSAALLATGSGAALLVQGGIQRRSRGRMWGLFGLWLVTTIPLIVHLAWAYRVAVPQLAPHFAGLFLGDSRWNVLLAGILLASAAAMLTVRLTAELRPQGDSQSVQLPAGRFVHERPEPILMALIAATWMFVASIVGQIDVSTLDLSQWKFISMNLAIGYLLPLDNLAKVAAFLALALAMWRAVRPSWGPPALLHVNANRFALVYLMSLVTCSLVPPALAWLGFTMLFRLQ